MALRRSLRNPFILGRPRVAIETAWFVNFRQRLLKGKDELYDGCKTLSDKLESLSALRAEGEELYSRLPWFSPLESTPTEPLHSILLGMEKYCALYLLQYVHSLSYSLRRSLFLFCWL